MSGKRGYEKDPFEDEKQAKKLQACVAGGMSMPTMAVRFGVDASVIKKAIAELGLRGKEKA